MLRSRHSGRSLLFALRSLLPAPFVAVRYEYSPYGELLEADVSPHLSAPCSLLHAPCFFGFQSKLRDPETGFWYFGHRFFDSRCAQWLTHDPLREEGGGFNLTCFCGGDPVNAVDPWGLFSNDDMLVEYVEKFGAEGLGLLNLLVGEFKDTGLAFAQHDFYAWQGKCQIGGGVVVLESDFTASQAAESLHNALRKRYGRFAGVLLQGATVGVCGVIRQSDNEVFREVMDELHWDDTAFDWNFTMARAGEVASFIQAGVETEVKWSVGAWIGAKSIELALEGVKTWRQARRLKAAAAALDDAVDAARSVAVDARLIGVGDDLAKAANWIKPKSGYYDVIVHGSEDAFHVLHNGNWVQMDHRSLATFIQKSGYAGGNIRLISCSSGASPTGIAKSLSNKMGVEVLAPNNTVWIHPNGSLTLGKSAFENSGSWVPFAPGL